MVFFEKIAFFELHVVWPFSAMPLLSKVAVYASSFHYPLSSETPQNNPFCTSYISPRICAFSIGIAVFALSIPKRIIPHPYLLANRLTRTPLPNLNQIEHVIAPFL